MILPEDYEISPTGIAFSGKAEGAAKWRPSRPAGQDFSAWGPWEVWEHQAPRDGGISPTGTWVAVNFGPQTGFMDQAAFNSHGGLSGYRQAQMAAVYQNQGRPTRVVFASGAWRASSLRHHEVKAQIEAEAPHV